MKLIKPLITSAVAFAFLGSLSGCAPANIQSQLRGSSSNSNMMTRCEEVDVRSNSELEELTSKYDGWRLIYVSEYTTGHKLGTSGAICFEKPMQ